MIARIGLLIAVVGVVASVAGTARVESADRTREAGAILEKAMRQGGVAVHIGCGDASLTVPLAQAGRFLMQGLAPTKESAAAARRTVEGAGIYGQVSIDPIVTWGAQLPYRDNIINLIVVDDLGGAIDHKLTLTEVLRVLCPNGVAMLGQSPAHGKALTQERLDAWLADGRVKDARRLDLPGLWVRVEKPRPAGMDDWTHRHHDAAGQATSHDSTFGPLHSLRWQSGPAWPMGEYYQVGNGGLLAAGGRMFAVSINTAENMSKDPAERDKSCFLVARDAWNGRVLWSRLLVAKRPVDPTVLADGLVASDKHVFLIVDSQLMALDAATGEPLQQFAQVKQPTATLALVGNVLVMGGAELLAFDMTSGKQLWKQPVPVDDLLVDDGKVLISTGRRKEMIAYDLKDGKQLWHADLTPFQQVKRQLLFAADGIVTFVWQKSTYEWKNSIAVFSTADGKLLWQRQYDNPRAHWPESVHYFDGLIWLRTGGDVFEGCAPRTGEVKRSLKFKGSLTGGCYRNIATDGFLIGTRPFALIDVKDGSNNEFRAGRHACRAGVIVANGMLYSLPHGCKCVGETLRGFIAYAPPDSTPAIRLPAAQRLHAGAAAPAPVAAADDAARTWLTLRHDPIRTSSTTAPGPAGLARAWQTVIDHQKSADARLADEWRSAPIVNERLTAPVSDGRRVVAAAVNSHRVVALDARTGKELWTFTAGGRIDTPPTLDRGLCLFGSRDGSVYALRLEDGTLAWRFQAAPADRRLVSFGQLESVWPVLGGVTVVDGRAYCIAGRTGTIDGGMIAYALDAATGKLLWEQPVTDGGMSDLGVYDRGSIFLGRLLKFDAQTGKKLTGGSDQLWGGSNQLLDRSWQFLSAEDRAQHWMRLKQGFGAQPNVTMNHIQHKFQVNEGSLVAADPAASRVYAYRVNYIHWNAKGAERNELGGSLVAWERGKELWSVPMANDFQVESLVAAGKRLFLAGPNHRFGRAAGGKLWIVSADDGKKLAETALEARPVSEGMAIVHDQLFLALENGRIEAYGQEQK